jgi:hypothetical protein
MPPDCSGENLPNVTGGAGFATRYWDCCQTSCSQGGRHQRSPDLVFQLYVAEGEITEADGLVVVQPVVPDVLVAGAARIQEKHPAIAAGWFLFAAHHRMATRRPSTYPAVVRDLTAVRDLSRESDQLPSYHRALQRFRQRYALRTRLIALLDEAGLGASGPP